MTTGQTGEWSSKENIKKDAQYTVIVIENIELRHT